MLQAKDLYGKWFFGIEGKPNAHYLITSFPTEETQSFSFDYIVLEPNSLKFVKSARYLRNNLWTSPIKAGIDIEKLNYSLIRKIFKKA